VSDYGWVPDPQAVEAVLASLPLPVASDMHWMRGTGEKAVALLHLSVAKVAGSFPIRLQTIGDCVSQGCACAVDVVKCVEIDLLNENEAWVAETATEPIYAGSRVEIGGGKIRGDGSVGAWAAKFVTVFGAIPLQRRAGEAMGPWFQWRARHPRAIATSPPGQGGYAGQIVRGSQRHAGQRLPYPGL
jgi:hypothetical protein